MSISRILNISRRGILAYQRAMDLAAHNIANAGNPDYTRQRAVFRTGIPEYMNGFEWGSGVDLDKIQRVRDGFVDNELRLNRQKFSNHDKRSSVLGRIEQFFSEPSESGISDSLSSFFSSWSELANTPNSVPLRNQVISSAQKLAGNLQSVYEGLDTVEADTFKEFNSKVDQVNQYLTEIQDYNVQISKRTLTGATANDLMDKRDIIIDKLSDLVNIRINYDSANSANISIGGILAVDAAHSLEFKGAMENGKLKMVTTNDGTAVKLTGGELSALSQVYSVDIVGYKEKLDSIFSTLVEKVNDQHSTGFSNTDPPVTGINFFQSYQDGVLTINQQILDDPSNIAVSSDGTLGNGDIALAISDINNQNVLNGLTLSENYSNLISSLGNDIQSSRSSADSSSLVVQQLEYERASYSGVSIDEEMSNVILYQKSYDASAKLVKIADEMLQTIINMV